MVAAGQGGEYQGGMKQQLKIPAVYMRGGTSKGVFFKKEDLPTDQATLERLLIRVIGSPDRYGKHTDGMGGATSSTSKIVILSKSDRPDSDVNYLFGQVSIYEAGGVLQRFAQDFLASTAEAA